MQLIHSRRLPHWYELGTPLFITFRLHNSLPPNRFFPARFPSGKAFVQMDRLLDAERSGPTHLRTPAIAKAVIAALQKGAVENFLLHAWVLMPNHVHLLITPKIDPAISLHDLKGSSAREANKRLGRKGQPFWQEESFDHLVRHPGEFRRIVTYIRENPVRAGLAGTPEAYPWSSIAWNQNLLATESTIQVDAL
ncbi:MAG: transposase [Paludibaculum sp.]